MGYVNQWICGVFLLFCAGCAAAPVKDTSVSYDEGYARGVKDGWNKLAETTNGNGFPYLAGNNWAKPLVQEVEIPAHVRGGVFYPQHNELVIITPGEWQKSGVYPIKNQSRPTENSVEILTADITALP